MTSANEDIKISITFRHTESTDALKSYATDKLSNCVSKYLKNPADVHIVLMVEKRDHSAEVTVRSKGFDATAKASTDHLYSAIDKVADTIDTQLRKQKEKLVEKHKS